MTKEVMKQALDALNESGLRWPNTIKALEEALKQEQGEPVANDLLSRACNLAGVDYQTFLKIKAYMPVYTTPQTKEWVGLTNGEILIEWFKIFDTEPGIGKNVTNGIYEFAYAILRKAQSK